MREPPSSVPVGQKSAVAALVVDVTAQSAAGPTTSTYLDRDDDGYCVYGKPS